MLNSIKFLFILSFLILIYKEVKCNNYVRVRQRPKQDAYISTFRYCPFGSGGETCELDCGNVYVEGSKIVGGAEAIPYSSPSTVFILSTYIYEDNPRMKTQIQCSGTLIDEGAILTAASCVMQRINVKRSPDDTDLFVKLDSVYAYLGTYSAKDYLAGKPPQRPAIRRKINKTIIHENFSEMYGLDDIAILKLNKNIKLNQYIQVACMPPSNQKLRLNEAAYVFGWGSTNAKSENSPSDYLKVAALTIYNSTYCDKVLPTVPKDWTKQICAGDKSGKKDVCNGDTGGPLFIRRLINDEFRYLLVGLTSYNDGCATKKKASIFTRVSAYIDWINSKLWLWY